MSSESPDAPEGAPTESPVSAPLLTAPRERWGLHALLFALALITTTLSGAELVSALRWWPLAPGEPGLGWADLPSGLPFALAFLAFLTTHEFGHYFAARRHGVSATLPYFLPIYIPVFAINIGSLGAVIRLRDRPDTTQKYFDIGVAGPLAGFVISLGVLIVGFITLPDVSYLHAIHPEYAALGDHMPSEREVLALLPEGTPVLAMGDNLLYRLLAWVFADPAKLPPSVEVYHYPLLFAGYITLFFTALNLLPIGQLDGGHVVYGLVGSRWSGVISRMFVLALIIYGGLGIYSGEGGWAAIVFGFYLLYLLYLLPRILNSTTWWVLLLAMLAIVVLQLAAVHVINPDQVNGMWLIYAFLAVRLIGLDHPRAVVEAPLDRRRQIIGWIALAIFVLCFTPEPLTFVEATASKGVFVAR